MPPAPEPSSRLSGNESSRPNRRPAVVLRASPPGSFAIFCGAHEPITSDNILESDYDEHRPGVVQILPETLSFSSLVSKEARTTRSNGCGTRLHGAMSSPRSSQSRTPNQPQCWYGEEKNVAETVVPLERRYFPQTLWEALDLCHDIGTAACGCVMNGVGCAVCGNPLGAVQTYCSGHSFRGSNAPRKGSTYIFAHSAVTAAPSSLPQAPSSNASSASAVDPALTMPLPPAQTAADNLFGTDFIQSVANGLDEFVDVGLFRGDGDLNFERDFGQWFNPDDMDLGRQTTPPMPSGTDDVGILPRSPNSNTSSSASSVSAVELAPPMPLPAALPPLATRQRVANGPGGFIDAGLLRRDGDINFERDFGQWFNPDVVGMDLGRQTVPTMPGVTPAARPRTRASSLRRPATARAAARPPPVPSPRPSRSGERSRRRRRGGEGASPPPASGSSGNTARRRRAVGGGARVPR
ncbi:hypothetical protein MSAN_01540700 [Mycena sanguinolenta]|uniref:Uncharacterized protein n=1 Tax=Mycena sanguinolenta TaxID=230812 RepID=A0A8H6Y7W0_9AGAR|nr:hypothetical protein MSAN_01540700 [Mycena sanguinolenta]